MWPESSPPQAQFARRTVATTRISKRETTDENVSHRNHPGDGIGKEVVPAGQKVMEALAASSKSFRFEFENFDWGADYFRKHGVMMPDDGLNALRGKDAIPFRVATRTSPITSRCGAFVEDLPRLRPVRQCAPDAHPARHRVPLKRCKTEDLDWVIVRENSEGEYAGVGGRVHQGHPIEAATDVSMMTRGCRTHHALRLQAGTGRPRKLLTVITKSNAQRHAMVMWDEIALQISKEFPDVTWDKELVDASTARMINRPASLDTIVATNLHADILSDWRRWPAASVSLPPATSIPSAATRRCSSPFTARPSTSWARAG